MEIKPIAKPPWLKRKLRGHVDSERVSMRVGTSHPTI